MPSVSVIPDTTNVPLARAVPEAVTTASNAATAALATLFAYALAP